ncbi:hypothetical protein Tco_0456147 [Tanacetum coccineum]
MASQDAKITRFEADFKQHQSEITNKLDTILKAFNYRMMGALPSDTIKNPKLTSNSTSSACSYPTGDPQSSSNSFKSVNAIQTCFKSTTNIQKDQLQVNTLTVNEIETPRPKEPEESLKDEFADLHLNLPVLEVLAHVTIYDSLLDKYMVSLELGKNGLGDSKPFDTLADLGSCVNLIPLNLFKKLNVGLLEETEDVLGLADGTKLKAEIVVGEGLTRSIFGVREIDFGEENMSYWTTIGRKAHLLGDKQIPSVVVFEEVIISLRRGIKPRNPQCVTKSYETCGSTVHTTTDHNDIKWFRKGEALQAKKAEAFQSKKVESSNANRSKTPTKRHMTGVKSYLHKYLEQPGPKVVFGDDSTCTTEGHVDNIIIAESERYPPDEYLHHYEPSQRYQVNRNAVSFIEPYKRPKPVVIETDTSSNQNDQADQNDHNDQNDHPVQNDEILNETLYRGKIRSLIYLTASRPGIQFSTCLCARYQANPKESHLIAVKRIFRDLKGACQLLGGKLVCWSAKKQQSIAKSLAEAEYVAPAGCCANILWLKIQLTNYGIIYEKVPIFCDNTRDIELHFILTQYQLADIFTKLLDEPTFKRLIIELGKQPRAKSRHRKKPSSSKHHLLSKIEATKSGSSSKEATESPTSHSKRKKKFSSAKDSNPSQPPASTLVVAGKHKEALQATEDPTSLGVSSEEGANPQFISVVSASTTNPVFSDSTILQSESTLGHEASIASTSKADPGILLLMIYSNDAKKEIKLEDLSKLILNREVDFIDLESPEYDKPIIVQDEDEEVHAEKVHAEQHKETEDASASQPPSPKTVKIQELSTQVHLL